MGVGTADVTFFPEGVTLEAIRSSLVSPEPAGGVMEAAADPLSELMSE